MGMVLKAVWFCGGKNVIRQLWVLILLQIFTGNVHLAHKKH